MKALVCMLITCVSLVTSQHFKCDCGWRNPKRIVNGRPTGKNEYPWMAYLTNGCGGSILTEWHILTAAHCTDGAKPSHIKVLVGMYYKYEGLNGNIQQLRVAEFIQHEEYDNSTFANDISIILLRGRIRFTQYVGPVCMPYMRYKLSGKRVKVTGWGITKGTGSDNVLREVDLKVISTGECKKHWKWVFPTHTCAYARGKDTCTGDSGGALVYLDPDTDKFTQVALVSYGPVKCGSSPKPSVNTNVFLYIEWIEEAVARKSGAQFCTLVNNQRKDE